jgi:hypothetical protein
MLALRPFKDAQESLDATMSALRGGPLGTRADLWEPYDNAKTAVLRESKPVSVLIRRNKPEASLIEASLKTSGHTAESLVYLPLVGRKHFWTAILDPATAQIVATIPIDPY